MAPSSLDGSACADCAYRVFSERRSHRGQTRYVEGGQLTPEPNTEIGVQVENLNAWFGKTQALQDISMNVAAKHATAIIGPSGCGKSTFVRCLNRMHETVRDARVTGRVRIGELDVYNGTPAVYVRR